MREIVNSLMKGRYRSINEEAKQPDDLIEKWVRGNKLSPADLRELAQFVRSQTTKSRHLERISPEDDRYSQGEIVEFQVAAFTSVRVSEGKTAGQIAWKDSDECLYILDNPKRGHDIDYTKVSTLFGAALERETLISGRYRVTEVAMIPEPGTDESYGYKIKAYYLKEV